MSEIKQYRVNDDGMTCREVNPINLISGIPIHFDPDDERIAFAKQQRAYDDFEASVINYPLTEKQKPRSVIEGEIVWQYEVDYDAVNSEWLNIDFPPETSVETVLYGYDNKREAVEPVTPSKRSKRG